MFCFTRLRTRVCGALLASLMSCAAIADDKTAAITAADSTAANQGPTPFQLPTTVREASRSLIQQNGVEVPLVIVRGTPYEMGFQLGKNLRTEIGTFIPAALHGVCAELDVSVDTLQEVWSRSAAYADDRVEQELAGLADGSGVPLKTLQAMHAVPLLMPYSCSSIAAWGKATRDGHLYQTRNLDWSMEIGAHNFAVVVVYVPDQGHPHVVPTFAGFIGAHTGMNMQGIALAEMGDASRKEAPYFVHAPHFTVYFRTLLYDADSLTEALDIFAQQPLTKRYHFVFGDGRSEKRAVKIVAHAPEPVGAQVRIMHDNDPQDEFAPEVLSCVVYNDEGRGAFPTLQQQFGQIDGEKLVALANKIPIKGGNVVNVVYDATDLRMWVTYAKAGLLKSWS
jgi:isopenicillin-N N-acyltransferase like protein